MYSTELQNYRPYAELIALSESQRDRLKDLGETIRKGDRNDRSYVLNNLVEKSRTQIEIALRDAEDPNATQIMAITARNLYELNLNLRYVLVSDECLDRFVNERVKDEIEILEGLLTAVADPDNVRWEAWRERKDELNKIMSKHNRELKKPMSAYEIAGVVGVSNEHTSIYKMYSKYSHMSSWIVNASEDDVNGYGYRNLIVAKIYQYAEDIVRRVKETVE